MSLRPQLIDPIPEETARVARAAFPTGNPYMRMRDEFGVFYQDETFAALFPARGQSAESPRRLALVLVMQHAENLSDRQAADAIRSRIDWKYALSLELTDHGFDYSVLSEFRDRLIAGNAEQLLLDTMLECFKEKGLLKARSRPRTDFSHDLAAVRVPNRLECGGETFRYALNTLAVTAPAWLAPHLDPAWARRYGPWFDEYRLPKKRLSTVDYFSSFPARGLRVVVITSVSLPAAQASLAITTPDLYRRAHTQLPGRARVTHPRPGPSERTPFL